jgi:hypothetical protein
VDCSYAKVERRIDGRLVSPMAWIGQLFAEWSLPMQPVIHLEDSPDDLADAGRVPLGQGQGARGKGQGHGAVLRIPVPPQWPAGRTVPDLIRKALTLARLTAEEVDLVLDSGSVCRDEDVVRAMPPLADALAGAARLG